MPELLQARLVMGPLFQSKAETSRFIIHLELGLECRCFGPQALLVDAAGLIHYCCPQMMTHRRAGPSFGWCFSVLGGTNIWGVLRQPREALVASWARSPNWKGESWVPPRDEFNCLVMTLSLEKKAYLLVGVSL
jgi:hypothetical protein